MLKFYKALNFRANELHGHEIQALLEKLDSATIFLEISTTLNVPEIFRKIGAAK